ncbi:MAG: DMT family transporter [Patescibacteria group bacterium]
MWLLFSILSPLLWAVANPLDAGLRRNFFKNDFVLTWLSALAKLPLAIALLIPFIGDISLNWEFFEMFLIGMFWTIPFVFYYKSMEFEEASRIILIMQFLPVFVLIIANLFIGETLTMHQFLAFLLILSAGILASFRKIEGKWSFSKAFWFMVTAVLLWATADVLFKYAEEGFEAFWPAFGVYTLGSSLPPLFLLLIPKYKKMINSHLKNVSLKGWSLLAVSVLAGTAGSFSFSYALTLGKASLTAVLVGIQPLLVFIFSFIFSRIFKEIPAESAKTTDLILKLVSIVLAVAGLIYLNY